MSGWKQSPFQIKYYYFCRLTETIRCTQVQENRQKTPTTKPSHSQVHNKQKFKLGTIVDTHKINITLQRRHEKIKHSEVDAHKDTNKHQAVNIQLVEDTLRKTNHLDENADKDQQKTVKRHTIEKQITLKMTHKTTSKQLVQGTQKKNPLRSRLAQLQTKHSEIDAHK